MATDRGRLAFILNHCRCVYTDKDGYEHEIHTHGDVERMITKHFSEEEVEDEEADDGVRDGVRVVANG